MPDYQDGICVDTGAGSFWIWTMEEWWFYAWSAVAYAIQFQTYGHCVGCSCKLDDCAYCLHECFVSR